MLHYDHIEKTLRGSATAQNRPNPRDGEKGALPSPRLSLSGNLNLRTMWLEDARKMEEVGGEFPPLGDESPAS